MPNQASEPNQEVGASQQAQVFAPPNAGGSAVLDGTLQPEPARIQREKRSPIQSPPISHPKPDKLMPKRLKLQALQGLIRQMGSSRKKVALIFTTIQM